MHYLDESHIFLFLVQILLLLSIAKILGNLFKRIKWPPLAGEILTGILLGPTILGRVSPDTYLYLFPRDLYQNTMLETVSWFGVLFLLLATGFEVKLSSIWKQGRTSLTIGIVGVLVPFILGCAVFYWLPSVYWGTKSSHIVFTLFLATAGSISAITIIAKILYDLNILRSDFGLVTLSAFVVNDILGWLIFTFVLGFAVQAGNRLNEVIYPLIFIIAFGVLVMTLGTKAISRAIKFFNVSRSSQSATMLTFIVCIGALFGAITQKLGLHAVLGFFMAGIIVGSTEEITNRTREVLSKTIHAIFVPIFFATIGIRIDFISNLDLQIVLIFAVVSVGGKFLGAWLGGLLSRFPRADALALGFAHIPGGAMEIILAILALELGIINESVFVAIVFAAIASSVVAGPLLSMSLKRRKTTDLCALICEDAIELDLDGLSRWNAIFKLCKSVSVHLPEGNPKMTYDRVLNNESLMSTGLEKGVAVPHARLDYVKKPIIAFGRSKSGIDWDARDGLPAKFIFLILVPSGDFDIQVQILKKIAQSMTSNDFQKKILEAEDSEQVYNLIREAFAK
jgi:Kef-type K+ transport system membrane component KefB/mannitol/fructose-specific phosphotransferase system IIA component (Ntr-type)